MLDLEKVIEAMTSEFVGFSDALVEGGSVRLDEGVVGPLLRGTLERFLELGRRAARDPDEGRIEESDSSTKEREKEKEATSDESFEDWQLSSEVLPTDEDLSLTTIPDFVSPHTPSSSIQNFRTPAPTPASLTSAFNPYLNDIWTPSLSPLTVSIVPYILAGRDSFASRLYFETISLAVRSLSGSIPWTFAASMFRYKLHFATRSQLFGVLAGVLNVLLQGTSNVGQGYSSEKTYEEEGRVKRAIVGEIEKRGRKEEEFLSTWEVETYLGSRWKLGVDSRAVRMGNQGLSGFAPTLVPGFEEREQTVLSAEGLVEKLKPAAMTIGEGPRWHLSDIDEVVKRFLGDNNKRGAETFVV